MNAQNSEGISKNWQQLIWIGVAFGLGLSFLLIISFVSFSEWKVINIVSNYKGSDLAFVFTSISLISLTLLRFLAILIGSAVIFGGLAVSFFTHAEATKITGGNVNLNSFVPATLATHSPGIVAVVLGSIIIIAALYAKSTTTYVAPTTKIITMGQQAATEAINNPLPTAEEALKNEKNNTETGKDN